LLLWCPKQVSTAPGAYSSTLPSLEFPKLAPSLQCFRLLLHHGLWAPFLFHFVLQHGFHLFFTLALVSFLHQSPSRTTTISHQPHFNIEDTSIILLGEISGIGNRAGVPLHLRTWGFTTVRLANQGPAMCPLLIAYAGPQRPLDITLSIPPLSSSMASGGEERCPDQEGTLYWTARDVPTTGCES
jgi:hypothetical protein